MSPRQRKSPHEPNHGLIFSKLRKARYDEPSMRRHAKQTSDKRAFYACCSRSRNSSFHRKDPTTSTDENHFRRVDQKFISSERSPPHSPKKPPPFKKKTHSHRKKAITSHKRKNLFPHRKTLQTKNLFIYALHR